MTPLLRAAFNRSRARRRKALMPFIMGGDPDLSTTGPLLLALQEAGADIIEVGIPFSDPLADGPVIQASASRAIARGATPERVLAAIASVKRRLRVPVVCLTYWNPVIQFHRNGTLTAARSAARGTSSPAGTGLAQSPEPFLQAAASSGVSGVIVPDLPVEEGALLARCAARAGLAAVFLASPTSSPVRLRMIARASSGFIYYVSVTGTTGIRRQLPSGLSHGVRQLKLLTTKPVCVGFGIATPAQARAVARISDGVIVGSALIDAIHRAGGGGAVRQARAFVSRLRKAV